MSSIAIVIDRIYPFYVGGYEVSFFKFVEILSRNNKVTLFTSIGEDSPNFKFAENVKIVKLSGLTNYINRKGQHSLVGGYRYWKALKRHSDKIYGFELVLINAIPYIYSKKFLNRILRNNLLLVSVFYEAWYGYLKNSTHNFIFSYILKRKIQMIVNTSSYVISSSNVTTNSLTKNYSKPKNMVYTIPIGIEKPISSILPIKSRKIDLLFLCRLVSIKHVEDLIKSTKTLISKYPDISLAIIGDGPERKRLERFSKKMGLEYNVTFYGNRTGVEKIDIISNSKLFVLPSEREGFSIATLEAMSLGCPPIIAKPTCEEVYGPSHFVLDGINGVSYPYGSVSDLTDRIAEILENKNFWEFLSENAMKTANQYYWDFLSIEIESSFREIMSKGKNNKRKIIT